MHNAELEDPLLGSNGEDDFEPFDVEQDHEMIFDDNPKSSLDVEDQETLEKKRKRTDTLTLVVYGLSGLSLFFQGLAIGYNYELLVVIISGLLASVVTSTTALKQRTMQKSDSLRAVHNLIKMEVNRFKEENDILSSNVNNLAEEVDRYKALAQQLETIAEKQHTTATELISLLKENKEILHEQKVCD